MITVTLTQHEALALELVLRGEAREFERKPDFTTHYKAVCSIGEKLDDAYKAAKAYSTTYKD